MRSLWSTFSNDAAREKEILDLDSISVLYNASVYGKGRILLAR
jgi:hypothetical protein